jgi:hypothetical protein
MPGKASRNRYWHPLFSREARQSYRQWRRLKAGNVGLVEVDLYGVRCLVAENMRYQLAQMPEEDKRAFAAHVRAEMDARAAE